MESFILLEFLPACLVMGMAIGIDAAIATSLNASNIKSPRQLLYWVISISLTHTLFPMLGYSLSYFGTQLFPLLSPLIGLLAFALIAHFLWQQLRPLALPQPSDQHDSQALVSLALILAVSWDALWSGPAKSAQVIGWPDYAIWTSFLLIGLTVTLLTVGALLLSRYVLQYCINTTGTPYLLAQWLQYSAISYFGWLALSRYTFNLFIDWQLLLLLSLLVMALILLACQPTNSRQLEI